MSKELEFDEHIRYWLKANEETWVCESPIYNSVKRLLFEYDRLAEKSKLVDVLMKQISLGYMRGRPSCHEN